jgi:hypothetical protein
MASPLATETWIQAPASTVEEWLSYTTLQQHPGNGVAADFDAVTGETTDIYDAQRFSVARTRRGYCVNTPASEVYSLTPGMRQAYATEDGGTLPEIDRGPYVFTTDAVGP